MDPAKPVRSWRASWLADRLSANTRLAPVMRLAFPAVGEQVLNIAVGIVDTFLVGHLGAASVAAVSISNQVVMLAHVLFASIATGSTALIARCQGAEDTHTARCTVNQSMWLGTAIGLATTVLGIGLAPQFVRMMGAEADALAPSVTYLGTVAYSFLLSTWMFVGMACLRGAGDTLSAMKIMLLVNALNAAIASALIYGPLGLPKLGVLGSALGAAIARSVGGLVVLAMLLRGRSGLKLDLHQLRPDLAIMRRILRIGIPTGVEQLLFRMADMSFYRVVATLGTAALAAHAIVLNANSLSYGPAYGFAVAATTLVGYGLGAHDARLAERDGYLAFKLGAAFMACMGLVFFVFARPLVGFFTTDPQVIALGIGPLRIVALAQPALAASMILTGGLRGAGDTRFPMLTNGVGVFIVRFGLGILFVQVLGFGLNGAWAALALDISLRGLSNGLRFRSGRWKRVKV